ncbi:MAG TPA: DUF6677 family protein [Thermoanaerobaculia bacterium]|nr:DUF6677 family protein [Thermoanaerobaculia bacterium]
MSSTAEARAGLGGRHPAVAVALAWILPGLGHLYLGRRKTALLYALIVTATFLLGLSFEGRLYTIDRSQPLSILATFAVSGAGVLNLAARFLSDNPSGAILAPTYEYGCAYLLTAGLMNLLLMLDAWDIAQGKK